MQETRNPNPRDVRVHDSLCVVAVRNEGFTYETPRGAQGNAYFGNQTTEKPAPPTPAPTQEPRPEDTKFKPYIDRVVKAITNLGQKLDTRRSGLVGYARDVFEGNAQERIEGATKYSERQLHKADTIDKQDDIEARNLIDRRLGVDD